MTIFIIALTLFLFLELLYFKIADHFNIIDKPNLRSSHTVLTIRGGGIIFPVALIAGVLFFDPSLWYLAFGVFAIALISFLDDVLTLNNKARIGVHIFSVLLILSQVFTNQYINASWGLNFSSLLLFLCSITLIIGIINAYNFMDGINGITVLYSIVSVGSFYYIQDSLAIPIIHQNILLMLLASLFVFGFFNLRKKAKSFSGDVGSISMALILCFLILQLILQTQDLKWILLLGIYGLDTVATICCRILRKENIFEAHRSHFYQFLVNDKKFSHIMVSVIYAVVQLLLNIIIISIENDYLIVLSFALLTILYVFIRLKYEGKHRLFNHY